MIDSDNYGTPDALTRKTTVRDLVATFQTAEATVRRCFAEIEAQQESLNAVYAMGHGFSTIHVNATDRDGHSDWGARGVESAITRMRRKAWMAIVERLELRRMLSVKRAIDMDKALAEEDPPDITDATVNAFVAQWAAQLPTMIEEAIRETFEWLRPRAESRRAGYVTNQRNAHEEIGERVVLTYAVERNWTARGFRLRYGSGMNDPETHFRALENVFMALDGAGQFSRGYKSAIELAIVAAEDGKWSTPYFSGRCFRNGNLHLKFERLDLLAEFNRRAGGRNLKTENAPR